ncbi:hypothetical protein [Puia dinghuensis]|uniref:Uncharacterized protein n=1 Tax=Puia dinghuensis TaxID=1792502 RepID=A0A8J2XVK0_9BACT|nr:hypothetical protein [Puia dinghuensis]GGB12806.1 hypothetical protein GCM10011511_40570 [Puia dinghuensis]
MEALEHELTPAESLKMISEVIGKTKENLRVHSYPYLLWGWIIAIASILFFYLQNYTSFKLYFLPFPVLVIPAIIATIVHYTRKLEANETYLGYYLKRLWVVLGLSFVLVVFINVAQGNQPFTYTLLIGGIGTLVSGLVLRFRPLVLGGLLFLVLTVVSAFITDSYSPLLQGIAVIGGYLIPGYLLKYSK